jgi:hypothetical protein
MVFGGAFTLLRYELRELHGGQRDTKTSLTIDIFAAFWATILSSPFNYVRTLQYATPPSVPHKSIRHILKETYKDALKIDILYDRFHYVQEKLKIGWGTARVCFGMAFSGYVYMTLSSSTLI